MSNIREQLLAKTAGIKATDARKPDAMRRASRTETAPGMAGALAAAQLRVQELESSGTSSQLPVGEISPNPWQPRRVFNEAKLTELAESIREVGLMQPIVVRRADATYQIIAGERRWRAHKMLGLDSMQAVVIECTDHDMAVLALVENLRRDDLTDYEISVSIRRSEQEFPDRKCMAEALGMSRAGLYRYFAFESLPEFVRKTLDLQPGLLGGHAAQDIVTALKKYGEDGLRAASDLWPDVVNGDLPQGKYAASIGTLAAKRGSSGDVGGGRSIEKFFAGHEHAGNITKDLGNFTVKIKTAMLTEDQEREIREVIGRLFSTQSRGS
ncbi:Chromosome (plasmid) partitioning protein ParB / Stage 0 sporulation protein J [Candidatus Burkholderia pumila]|uniref:Chromosome (Plasmid) partitioning protein ParB / Stage 0 sporulation protein J n=1 Tax=Candidatus Burkholderia pumila TaxID=1090375 RepID=A0ABR5HKY0_9BURK|nr:Chromosome (plasmid) partitioning protein ParB / Stage 0 sporulation protein J [Candidatus Burkholderia pumila]